MYYALSEAASDQIVDRDWAYAGGTRPTATSCSLS